MYPPAINSSPNGPDSFLLPSITEYPNISLPKINWKKISKQTNNEQKVQEIKNILALAIFLSNKNLTTKYKIKYFKKKIDFKIVS